ncbi:hypothetical protein MMC30_008957 [Trapelia coarctata]|nr:hypothetical protein [Trapelia coarctata]
MSKRGREDNEIGLEVEEPHSDRKKPRTLPFRTSPTSKHGSLFSFSQMRGISRPPVLTPAESEDGSDQDSPKYSQGFLTDLPASSQMNFDDTTADLEMVDSEPLNSPPSTPALTTFPTTASSIHDAAPLAPIPINRGPHRSVPNTRIPTPIYGHFNISPQDPTIGTPINATPSEMNMPESAIHSESHHDLFLRRRRLPTPIDENADMESPTTVTGSMLRNLDMGATLMNRLRYAEADIMTPDTPNLDGGPVCTYQTHSAEADVMTGNMTKILDMDTATTTSTNPTLVGDGDTNMMMPDSSVHPANTHLGSDFTKKRRGAVVEGTALTGIIGKGGSNPGGKIGFYMGFRSDCEKCRDHVPGHYAHFLRYD